MCVCGGGGRGLVYRELFCLFVVVFVGGRGSILKLRSFDSSPPPTTTTIGSIGEIRIGDCFLMISLVMRIQVLALPA